MFRLILIIILAMIFYSYLKKLLRPPHANPHVKDISKPKDDSQRNGEKKSNIEDADYEDIK